MCQKGFCHGWRVQLRKYWNQGNLTIKKMLQLRMSTIMNVTIREMLQLRKCYNLESQE